MGRAARLLFGALLLSVPSAAEQSEQITDTGKGLICYTSTQVERFMNLVSEGGDTDAAIHTVNDEAANPIACGIILVEFTRGELISHRIMKGEPVSIVEITVVAVNIGLVWERVPATNQYTIYSEQGENAPGN
jgi:hypothetical protein